MRREVFVPGSFVHVYNCGTRKLPIVRDMHDKEKFLKSLYFFNDVYVNPNWLSELKGPDGSNNFTRPATWPKREPIVSILAYCLMPNHFHLLLEEIVEGGIAKFMQKFGTSMSNGFNTKYKEIGSLFQGTYKTKVVKDDSYLKFLAIYIMLKNPFELYKGGLKGASKDFDSAFDFALNYKFCSLADYYKSRGSEIIDKEMFSGDSFPLGEFKSMAREYINEKKLDQEINDMLFDEENPHRV